MSLRLDIHVHTNRYSSCSRINPERLISQGVKAGLDGIVITEHHRQWEQEELDELVRESRAPGFILLSGFEYTSSQGDILIYGLSPSHVARFPAGGPPEEAIRKAMALGGVCVAAHPTRAGMSFDERISGLPLAAIEVCSVNLKEHEQRLAMALATMIRIPPIAGSDAHQIQDVGQYATDFDTPVRTAADLHEALTNGKFRLSGGSAS